MTDDASAGRGWAAACHLAALVWLIGVPFGHVLGPLIVWLILRDRYPFVDDQGKEALNFQISFTIYGVIVGLLIGVLVVGLLVAGIAESPTTAGFALLIVPAVGLIAAIAILELVLVIVAAIQASDGRAYRYPLTLRLVR